jgi:non-canonical (house-cleaning) NTP pyrophosphatase
MPPSRSSAFWTRLPSGVEVAASTAAAAELLGVRDGFLRYFRNGLSMDLPVVVVPHPTARESAGLHLSDESAMSEAMAQASGLQSELGEQYHFYVGCQGCVHTLESDGAPRCFVRSWTAVVGVTGDAFGSSGSVEIPQRLVEGVGDGSARAISSVPGTRRRGGMIGSLTGGLENRRSAVAASTLHALSSLLYEVLSPDRSR